MSRSIMNLDQIDAFLEKLKTVSSDDELRSYFSTYSAKYDTDVPKDPFGIEYHERQFSLYKMLARKDYSVDNEKTSFDIEDAAVRPFPYIHGSSTTVGNQLMAIGYLIRKMDLRKGAKILEFGPGWGNTTLALAKMGYRVTAVDIENNFIELIGRRAAMEKLEIELIHGDFSFIEATNIRYDAVLFFECFHHAQDHLRLMQAFDRVLTKDGIVCFGSEPVTEDFPIPWGLRMDGESLWAIRNNGWLELGFNKKYFFSALDRFGWAGFEHVGVDGPWSKVIIAKRKNEIRKNYTFGAGKLRSVVGSIVNEMLETSLLDEGYIVFGPYDELPVGNWRAQIEFDDTFNCTGILFIDIVEREGSVIVAGEKQFLLDNETAPQCSLYFANESFLERFEMRVRCKRGTRVRICGISLTFIPNWNEVASAGGSS